MKDYLGAEDLCVQMENATDGWYCQMQKLQMAERMTVQVVIKRTQRMVVSH